MVNIWTDRFQPFGSPMQIDGELESPVSLTHTHSLSHTHTLSLPHTYSLTHAFSLSLFHTRTLSQGVVLDVEIQEFLEIKDTHWP